MDTWNERFELIDLSQEIYEGMPVFGKKNSQQQNRG